MIWVGTPPVKNERASAEFLAINDLYRERVQKAGAIYVDIWPGFVDDQNRYAATGPDVEGQVVRLRSADGVYFTRAGARKAAHFADIELKRLIEQRGGTAVAAPSTDGTPAAKELDVERVISASLPALPEPQGLPSLPVRPVAGPVLPLTKPDTSPGGALASGRPRLDGDAYLVDRALREGLPVPPKARTSRRVQVAAVVDANGPSSRQDARAHQMLVDRARRLAALADRPDDQRLAAPHVAAGEDLVDRGLVVAGVGQRRCRAGRGRRRDLASKPSCTGETKPMASSTRSALSSNSVPGSA